jgi:protein phosphatase
MIESGGLTDVGRWRRTNEDTVLVDAELGIYIVADGAGEHAAGKLASGLAAETIRDFIRSSPNGAVVHWPFGADPRLSFGANRLRTGVLLAN